ncbi:hypothetical protein [Sinorhizobium sp. BG8]|uniref:hypothetical protein n=1 Tax=Sinorhizobium sp. BG8 TaxID=2613773 RepID=UPI00193E0D3B|nr:hypothetical protein [Sinorhizobium sp. BG8]QRM54750.1 hypothetical protein F3Y30_09495 [Sinorhizobium sp. BG8]
MVDIIDQKWSELDASNTGAAPDGVQGGYAPSTIAPILRGTRGALKRFYNRINAAYTTTGSVTAAVLTFSQGPVSYAKGERFAFWANATNTDAMTLNINALGAKSILRGDGTALVAGDIGSGQFTELVYDGTAFRIVNGAGAKYTGNVTAATFTGNGVALTNLNASNLSSGIVPNTVISGSYDGMDTLTANRIRLLSTTDASETSTAHGFQVGADNSANVIIDNNEILFRNNGVLAAVNVVGSSVAMSTASVTAGGNTVWHAGNDGAGTGLDADLVDGYEAARLFRDNASFSTTGNLTISNSGPVIDMIDTTSGQYSSRLYTNSNNFYIQQSPDNGATWATMMQFEMDTNNAYANGQQIWTNGNVTAAVINGKLGYTPVTPARTVTAGNGLTGGGALSANQVITLGTPANITNSTTNSVSTSSHTHALGFIAAEVSTTTSAATTSFPLGHLVYVRLNGSNVARNGSSTIYLMNTDTRRYTNNSGSSDGTLSGTYRARGDDDGSYGLFQRTA